MTIDSLGRRVFCRAGAHFAYHPLNTNPFVYHKTRNMSHKPDCVAQMSHKRAPEHNPMPLTEADVEQAALNWLSNLGWQTAHGPDIAPNAPNTERADYAQVVLDGYLRDTLARLNPDLPTAALGDGFGMITRPQGAALEARNHAFRRMLAVECQMA